MVNFDEILTRRMAKLVKWVHWQTAVESELLFTSMQFSSDQSPKPSAQQEAMSYFFSQEIECGLTVCAKVPEVACGIYLNAITGVENLRLLEGKSDGWV